MSEKMIDCKEVCDAAHFLSDGKATGPGRRQQAAKGAHTTTIVEAFWSTAHMPLESMYSGLKLKEVEVAALPRPW